MPPRESGLYIVVLKNDEPISAQAADARNAENAIKVNRRNCKFGKARNLAGRKLDYEKTFGASNVNFHPLALLKEIDLAEREIKKELKSFAVRGRTGRRNEWLERISAYEVAEVAKRVLPSLGVEFRIVFREA